MSLLKKLLLTQHHISSLTELFTSLPQSKSSFILWPCRTSCPDHSWGNCTVNIWATAFDSYFFSCPCQSFPLNVLLCLLGLQAFKCFSWEYDPFFFQLLVSHSAWGALACAEIIISGVFNGILVAVLNSADYLYVWNMDDFRGSVTIIHRFKTSAGVFGIYCHSHPCSGRKTNRQLHLPASPAAIMANKNNNFKIPGPGLV